MFDLRTPDGAHARGMQLENVIRREMRLGQRIEYGRDSLAIARRCWQ